MKSAAQTSISQRRLTPATTAQGFVALVRSVETFDLLRDVNAFSLLALIVLRARYAESRTDGLTRGQMLLGRDSTARDLGLKQGATREATKRLVSAGFITTSATSRGTIVTVTDAAVFDIGLTSDNQPPASGIANEQPTNNQRPATKEEGNIEKIENKNPTPAPPQPAPQVTPLPFASPEFAAAWSDFQQHRRELKRKLTPLASVRLLQELERMGEPRAIAAINHSIGKGWQGIFEPDAKNGTPGKSGKSEFSGAF